jgi:hypothetical protein
MAGSSLIGNLAVTLGLNTAAFSKGATQAEMRAKTLQGRMAGVGKSMAGIGASLGIGLGIGAVVTLTQNAFEMASSLNEAAQKAGVTVEALQELRVAAQQTGVSEDQLSTAMGRLNKSMGELSQGKSAAVAAFAAIGLAAEDLKGKTPEQALRLIADQLNKLPTVQERVAAGSAIMGRSFSQLLPLINGGSAALDKYAQESRKAGQISTEDAKKLDDLADSWDRLKTRVGVATANMIAGTARFLESSDKMVVSFWSARDRMIEGAANMASSVVSYVNNMVSGIQQAITGKLAAIWEGAKAKIESVRQKFADMYDAVVGNSYVPDMVDGIAQSMMQLGRVLVDPAVTATDKVAAVFQNLQGVLGDIFGRKAGGIIGIIGQFATALAPLIFGKGAPGAIWETGATGGAIGMASGGSGVFGGRSGVDRNLLSLNGSPIARVSRGEHFAVSPANDRAPRNVTIQQTFQFEGVAVTKTEFMQGLMMTKSATIGAIRDMDRRR